jgi:hypothetical protein
MEGIPVPLGPLNNIVAHGPCWIMLAIEDFASSFRRIASNNGMGLFEKGQRCILFGAFELSSENECDVFGNTSTGNV